MNLDAYERFDRDVNAWVDAETNALKDVGVQVIECSDLIQTHANIVILPAQQFQIFCKATGQQVAFLYRGECAVSALIQSTLEEACDEDEDAAPMVRAFETQNLLLTERARAVCPTHFYAEMTLMHQGGFVAAGVVAQAYEDILMALRSFCESLEGGREEAKDVLLARDAETLEQLADELMNDAGFAALRGKRKRCVYVTEKYGLRVPRHPAGGLQRVDPYSGYLDAYLVNLVERVSDRLALRNVSN
jgi:hypothetical protein